MLKTEINNNRQNINEPEQESQLKDFLKLLAEVLLFIFFINTFLLQTYVIPSPSMENSMLVGDHFFVEGGKIRIEARNIHGAQRPQAEEFVRLSIADTGTGMPRDVAARAFEPFFTTKDVGKGSGLGLAQVYGFVQQSNGEVEIQSTQGKGTAVILTFPRSANEVDESEKAEAVPGAKAPRPAEARSRSRGDILFVEDDVTVASLTAGMLRSAGYDVQHVKSASAALQTLAQDRSFFLDHHRITQRPMCF